MQENGQPGRARSRHGERSLRFRVTALKDRDQGVDQLVSAKRTLAQALSLGDKVRLQGSTGLGTGPQRHLAEAGDQARAL
jgi:hypothetical protein